MSSEDNAATSESNSTTGPLNAAIARRAATVISPDEMERQILEILAEPPSAYERGACKYIMSTATIIARVAKTAVYGGDGQAFTEPAAVHQKMKNIMDALGDTIAPPALSRWEGITAEDLLAADIQPPETVLEADGEPLATMDTIVLGDGPTRAGKGWVLCTALPIILAAGESLGPIKAPRPRRVLMLTVEDTRWRTQFRNRAVLDGLGLQPGDLGGRLQHIIRPRGGVHLDCRAAPRRVYDPDERLRCEREAGDIIEGIIRHRPEIIILDNLARMLYGTDSDHVDARAAMDLVDEIRELTHALIILIHHHGKSGKKPGADKKAFGSRGSTVIPGVVDGHLTIEREDGSDVVTMSAHSHRDLDNMVYEWRLASRRPWQWDVQRAEVSIGASGRMNPDPPKPTGPSKTEKTRRAVREAVLAQWRAHSVPATLEVIAAIAKMSTRSVREHADVLAANVEILKRAGGYVPLEAGQLFPPKPGEACADAQ